MQSSLKHFARHSAFIAVFTTFCVLATDYCFADAPSVSYIFPAGGRRGTSVNFHVGGHYLHDTCPFEMLGSGVKASAQLTRAKETLWFDGPVIPLPDSQRKEDYPWAQNGSVEIADNAELGFRRWRVWTSQGVAESMPFVVGDLPEIVEQEIDGDPIPTQVELPITINGRMFPREDVDIWTFQATANTSYTCEVMANRIGSPLDSRLAVFDPQGRLVAENVDGKRVDSYLRFRAEETGLYKVHIHDVNFDGLQHFVYRLTITDQPHVDHIYPLGGRRGTSTAFKLYGQDVTKDPLVIDLPTTDESLWRQQVTVDNSVANEVVIELGDLPECLEEQVNEGDTQSLPMVMNGCIREPSENDYWWIELTKGEKVSLAVHAAQLGSMLDSALSVTDESGRDVASNDDVGNGKVDSSLIFTAPADGRFRITIRDTFASRGDERFAYRLYAERVSKPRPDFRVLLPVDALTLERGSEAKLKFVVERKHGFQGAVTLDVDGLPEGVTVTDNVIKEKKNDTQLIFKADDNAKIRVSKLIVRGTATINELTVSHPTIKPAAFPQDLDVNHLLLAVAMPTPFQVVGEFETRYAARGSTFSRHYTIDRGGFEGPITVRMAERQVRHLQGVTGPTMVVPPTEAEFDYPIKLPPWMEVGRTSRTAVMAVADVQDRDGAIHRVSYTSHAQNDQVIVLVDPGQLALRLETTSLAASPQARREIYFHVERGQGITGSVKVQLMVPNHIRGISSPTVDLREDQDTGKLLLEFGSSPLGPWNMPLAVRATATKNGTPYTAEAKLVVVPSRSTSGDTDEFAASN